jgi:hypothetical protein
LVYEWQWQCPQCKKRQPFTWSKQLPGEAGYVGFNWDSILMPDGSTNITDSSATTWLECEYCRAKINDTPQERRTLNDTGEYILIKSDGDPSVVTFMAPCFVNPNISFASKAAEYMVAKRSKKNTGLDELLEIFYEQSLGKFYKREEMDDPFKILITDYDKDVSPDFIYTMGVDVQETGNVKYYVVRAWNKNGNESRRIDFGICRSWDELEAIRVKYKIFRPSVHVDSGDGNRTQEIYQECVLHGEEIQVNKQNIYTCWTPTKGDQKVNYKHQDNIVRLYSPISPQDAGFPYGHKLKGRQAPLILFSNYGVKTILSNLRDNLIEGVKWLNDLPDTEYDKQMFSERLVDVVDKKSGQLVKRWIASGDNHFYDCEVLCLLGAIRAKAFSSIKINEDDLMKLNAQGKLEPIDKPAITN